MTEKDNNKSSQPKENQGEVDDYSGEDEDSSVANEYDMLDSKLDDLNQALDFLEQKNDDIHQKLKELLQSNRDIREQLKNQSSESSPSQ